jgi:hypothetical protein
MIKTYACSKFYKNDQLKYSTNPSILQITTDIQFKSNHPTYLFDFLQIMIDIQLKLNDSIYMSDETHRISNICTSNKKINQLQEFNQRIELK